MGGIAYTSTRKKLSVQFPYHATVRDLASHSDALILFCALTEENRHVVDKEVMAVLGERWDHNQHQVWRAHRRGGDEMVWLLVRWELGGAGLDVFENEAHVQKELCEMDNVVLSLRAHSGIIRVIEGADHVEFEGHLSE